MAAAKDTLMQRFQQILRLQSRVTGALLQKKLTGSFHVCTSFLQAS
jgi:hypothetical protein